MKPIEIEKQKANACPNCYFDWGWRSHDDLWRYRCNIGVDAQAVFSSHCTLKDWVKCPLNKEVNQ